MSPQNILAIGVMTGNSLDGADFVLTKFGSQGGITDIACLSKPYPRELSQQFRSFRQSVSQAQGEMKSAIAKFPDFEMLLDDYMEIIASGVKALLQEAGVDRTEVDIIGFHGQTCAHLPPSLCTNNSAHKNVYTVQIGDGQRLADLTGIAVAYDFRSDDIMNGGEGAPLAPMHHAHLAEQAKKSGFYPIAFCNAGNTGNLTLLTKDEDKETILGFDTGPFNHYTDALMRYECSLPYDEDGSVGSRGKVNEELLQLLFDQSARTVGGQNYYELKPPKSSDPEWYVDLPELFDESKFSFEDRVRTVQYFAAYLCVYSLTLVPETVAFPNHFALCGGGWKNAVTTNHFIELISGNFKSNPILEKHRTAFQKVTERLTSLPNVKTAENFGYSSQSMEARLMADAAACRVRAIPFTTPRTTGTKSDTVLGILRFPHNEIANASENLRDWLESAHSLNLTQDDPKRFDPRWSRASAGWYKNSATPVAR